MKNKKLIIVCILVVLVIIAGVLILFRYNYIQANRIVIGIQVLYNEDGNSYIDDFVYSYSPDNISKKNMQNLSNFLSDSKTFHEDFKEKYKTPYQVRATIETPLGKTIVHYSGIATNKSTGETENINRIFEYDFVLIRNPDDLQRTDSVS